MHHFTTSKLGRGKSTVQKEEIAMHKAFRGCGRERGSPHHTRGTSVRQGIDLASLAKAIYQRFRNVSSLKTVFNLRRCLCIHPAAENPVFGAQEVCVFGAFEASVKVQNFRLDSY
ncbi:hypothetical protein PoB_006461600 [Plakobranchus ocellatus]|uniref:Uncharacterized protein n=1 Tax=Plakobranchus ocellatus TaxID=259542 RepID=A0AAV4D1P8_9GAST|nr:hypothetical protein PoB_006461600 [Plakobranchus ocellatus]